MGRRRWIIRLLSLLVVVPFVALLAGASMATLDALHGVRIANRVLAVAEVDRALLRGLIALRELGGPLQTALQVEADPRPQIAKARARIATNVRPVVTSLIALGLPEAIKLTPGAEAQRYMVDQSFALVDAAAPGWRRWRRTWRPATPPAPRSNAPPRRSAIGCGWGARSLPTWWNCASRPGRCGPPARAAMLLLRPAVARSARLDARTTRELGRLRGATGAAAERMTALAASPATSPLMASQVTTAVAAVGGANQAIDQVIARLGNGRPAMPAVDWTHGEARHPVRAGGRYRHQRAGR